MAVMTDKEKMMAEGPIIRTMLKMGVPAFIAQFVYLLYNIVDRIYIGHIPNQGSAALTGVGVCFPILALITAFANFAGAGGSPLAGIELGAGSRDKAEKIMGNAAFLLITAAVFLTILFQIIKKPFLYMFGASDNTYPYAGEYLAIYLFGTLFVLLALGLNSFIMVQGYSTIAMLSVLMGAVLNIVIDPILIFALGMGVRGAAIATIISQFVSSVWILGFLTSKKAILRLRLRNLKPDLSIIGRIASLGVSPFIMAATESLITIAFNTGALKYGGDLYVGSITILQSTVQMILVPINGFAMGIQPLISYNYGARNFKRAKSVCFRLIGFGFVICASLCSLCMIVPGRIASVFTSDIELIDICQRVMPIFVAGMLLFGLQSGSQSCFMALGKAKQAFFFACLRKIILLTPLVIILPMVTQSVMGIYYAEPISDSISALCCVLTFLVTIRGIESGSVSNVN